MRNQSIHESIFQLKYFDEYTPKAGLPSQRGWPMTQDTLEHEISIEQDASSVEVKKLLRVLASNSKTSEDESCTQYIQGKVTGQLVSTP
jgi:hypothetical protein